MGRPLKQIRLIRDIEGGTATTTCWISEWKKIKVGSRITLKEDPDTWWTVEHIGDTILDSELLPHGPWGSLKPNESIYE